MQDLRVLTTVIDLLALATATWLGFYIVTRSVYSLRSWLASLTLWTLGTHFAANAILNSLHGSVFVSWLQQFAALVLPLMLNLTYLLMPPSPGARPSSFLGLATRRAIPFAYATAILFFSLGALPSAPGVGLLASATSTPAEGTAGVIGYPSRIITPLYPFFVLYLAVVSALALANLWQAREQSRRSALVQPFGTFFLAVACAGAGGLYAGIGTWLQLDIPTFPSDLLLGVGAVLVGVAVARYAALLQGRPLERDFFHTLMVVGALTALYVSVTLFLFFHKQVSFLMLVLTIVGTIAANSLFDALRLALDRLLYRRQFQVFRTNLRDLAREAGTAASLGNRLQSVLDALCRVLEARRAFVALAENDQWNVLATHDSIPIGARIPQATLAATETVGLVHPEKKGLAGMKLLLPLLVEGSQVGALVLGGKDTPTGFSESELDLAQDLGDQMAELVHGIRRQELDAQSLNAMVESFIERERALQLQVQDMLAGSKQRPASLPTADALVPPIEDALRHYHDLAHLGDSELARLDAVTSRLPPNATTLDRGRTVGQVLAEALEKLRPAGPEPGKTQVPARDWHSYLILHDSYMMDEPNRDIMSRLYISEGTFNRTRRKAIQAVAQTVAEWSDDRGRRTAEKETAKQADRLAGR